MYVCLFVCDCSIEDGHVIPGLIHKCYLAKKNGKIYKTFYLRTLS